MSLTDLHLRAACARIAAAVAPPMLDPSLGTVTLRHDQRATAARVAALLSRHGGCLLADDVGTGKTFVALAVARRWARVLVVVPASLRALWTDACRRAGVPCDIVSHERMSRGWRSAERHDGVIVDESHRFRSPLTRRYGALVSATATAPVLLLSATPLQNRRRDLSAQIALFVGARAHRLDDAALAAFVVRGPDVQVPGLPRVARPRSVRARVDDGTVLDALLALPPPPLPRDGGEAGVLRTIGLVRAWASSRAALRATLGQRRRAATAIGQSLAEGLVPSRHELRAWYAVDDAIQLGFAPLLVDAPPDSARVEVLRRALRLEEAALDALARTLAASSDPDRARADVLRDLRRAHPDARLLAFTERAITAKAYFDLLRAEPGVGLLTAREGRIASGRIGRDALLERFAPRAHGRPSVPARETVTLLIATDLLSEGMNLQDASVVVHLDLPWNPARLAQRVGRLRRPGGAAAVHGIFLLPPARAEQLVQVEQRLRQKLLAATAAIGRGVPVLPGLTPDSLAPDTGNAAVRGTVAAAVARWARPSHRPSTTRRSRVVAAGTHSTRRGWLAALDDGRLVGAADGRISDDAGTVSTLVGAVSGRGVNVNPSMVARARSACARWIHAEAVRRSCGLDATPDDLDAMIERRIARVVARTARHDLHRMLGLAAIARAFLGGPRPLGAERLLRDLMAHHNARCAALSDAAWLERTVAILSAGPRTWAERGVEARIVALVILAPDSSGG